MNIEIRQTCQFEDEGLRGCVCGGPNHGVQFLEGGTLRPISRAACMNVEHYYSDSVDGGMFAPRRLAAADVRAAGDNAVRVDIAPDDTWRVRTTVTYTLLPERTVRADYAFAFEQAYPMFEAFLSNYFYDETPPWLHVGGQWRQVQIAPLEHRYWMRSAADAARFAPCLARREAETQRFVPDCTAPIDEASYDYPVMVTPIAGGAWSVVHWFDAAECLSLSANRRWRAHDFSFIGRDVAAGETVACRGWMSYQNLESLDASLDLWRRTCGAPSQE